MKTTVDIPDSLLSRAKVSAAQAGTTMRMLVVSGLERTLQELEAGGEGVGPAWITAFGGMRRLRAESDRIRREIEAEFEQVDDEVWQ